MYHRSCRVSWCTALQQNQHKGSATMTSNTWMTLNLNYYARCSTPAISMLMPVWHFNHNPHHRFAQIRLFTSNLHDILVCNKCGIQKLYYTHNATQSSFTILCLRFPLLQNSPIPIQILSKINLKFKVKMICIAQYTWTMLPFHTTKRNLASTVWCAKSTNLRN